MILPCPACQARFMVPDERITPRGIKIRCPKCRFVFIMKAQKRAVPSAAAQAQPAASGAIGQAAAPAPKKKAPRKRSPEAEAAKLSEEEIAAVEDEIVDMDDLAQATEQSGTAYNPNIKAEHFEPVASSGPSVMIDDSLLTAAAAHSASWTETPVAADDLPRMSHSAAVSDTWIDIPGRPTPGMPPAPPRPPVAAPPRPPMPAASSGAISSGSIGAASGAISSGSIGAASGAISSGSIGSASGAISSGSMGAASGAISSGSMGAASGSLGAAAAPPAPPAPPAEEEEAWPEPSLDLAPEPAEAPGAAPFGQGALEDTDDTVPGDVLSPFAAPGAASLPVAGAASLPVAGAASLPVAGAAPPRGAFPGAGIPAPPPAAASGGMDHDEIPLDELEPVEAVGYEGAAPSDRFEMAYTLTAASSITADELAELEEYEGLLVEERRALRKGHAATAILIVGICLGIGILSTLGYLGYQVLNPPKKQPPSWGHLQLSRNDHTLVTRKRGPAIVVATVNVRNASSKFIFKNVHVMARLLSPSGEVKCQSYAPCGPKFSPEELEKVTDVDYLKALRGKGRVTAYNVQLNPSQEERCQVVLFCGDRYSDGRDRVQIEVDKEHSERVSE